MSREFDVGLIRGPKRPSHGLEGPPTLDSRTTSAQRNQNRLKGQHATVDERVGATEGREGPGPGRTASPRPAGLQLS